MTNIHIIGLLLILIIYLELTKKHRNIRGGNPEENTEDRTILGMSIPVIIVFILCVGIVAYVLYRDPGAEQENNENAATRIPAEKSAEMASKNPEYEFGDADGEELLDNRGSNKN